MNPGTYLLLLLYFRNRTEIWTATHGWQRDLISRITSRQIPRGSGISQR